MFASAKEKLTKIGSTATVVRNCIDHKLSHITFWNCCVHIFFLTTLLKIAVY